MSGLSEVLDGRRPPAVYRWDATYHVADVRHLAERAGWRFGVVDGWAHGTKGEVLTALGEALALPSTYGANLDALHDSVGDLAEPTVLLWEGWSMLARSDDRSFRILLRILGWSPHLVVLLRGDGPAVDVPTLE